MRCSTSLECIMGYCPLSGVVSTRTGGAGVECMSQAASPWIPTSSRTCIQQFIACIKLQTHHTHMSCTLSEHHQIPTNLNERKNEVNPPLQRATSTSGVKKSKVHDFSNIIKQTSVDQFIAPDIYGI